MSSETSWPGGLYAISDGSPDATATVARPFRYIGNGVYWNGYVGDTITKDRYTFNLGVRWDRQASSSAATSVPASDIDPVHLPALNATAIDNAVVYNSIAPRLGLTYALGKDRKTLLRATYARFADQLDSNVPKGLSLATIPGLLVRVLACGRHQQGWADSAGRAHHVHWRVLLQSKQSL